MPPEFGRKWGTVCLNTRFPLPTLLYAGYNVKLIYFIFLYFVYKCLPSVSGINDKIGDEVIMKSISADKTRILWSIHAPAHFAQCFTEIFILHTNISIWAC